MADGGGFNMDLLARQTLADLLQPHAVGAFAAGTEPGSLQACEQAWLCCGELPDGI